MQRNAITFICSIFCLLAMASAQPTPTPLGKPSRLQRVVVLSFGGLKREYVNSDLMPNLAKFYRKYASANYLKPVFPPKTSVNHFSIATGLYPDKHGVIYNCKFDEERPYDIDPDPSTCVYEQYKQELNPLWIENQIKDGVSGVLNWPGSDQKYQGRLPIHRLETGEECKDYQTKTKKIISWLEHETKPANLVMAYFDELDILIHQNDPTASYVENAIKRIDAFVKDFIDILERKQINQYTNVIIIGTQGIHTLHHDKGINLKTYTFLKNVPFKSMGANAIISPTDDEYTKVYESLKREVYGMGEPPYNVYKHKEIPEKWHLQDSSLFNKKLLLVANPEHFFWTDYLRLVLTAKLKIAATVRTDYHYDEFKVGIDGYDNEIKSMMSFFVGIGPNFMPNLHMESFYTIDIHSIIRELLQLKGYISKDQPVTLLNENIKKLLKDLVFTTTEDIENTNREMMKVQSNIYEKLPFKRLILEIYRVISEMLLPLKK